MRLLTILVLLLPLSANAQSWEAVVNLFKSMQDESSAYSVVTKQTALSANQMGDAAVNSKKQLATATGAILMSDRVTRAALDVDPVLGQPITIKCEAQRNGKLFVEATSQSQRDVGRLMQSFASSRVGSKAKALQEAHVSREHFCTVSEAKQGLCELKANGLQGWDINYANAFSEKTLAPEGEVAGYAYVNMLTDTRADALSDCFSTACEVSQSQQLAMTALSAMAANSLIGQIVDRRSPVITGE